MEVGGVTPHVMPSSFLRSSRIALTAPHLLGFKPDPALQPPPSVPQTGFPSQTPLPCPHLVRAGCVLHEPVGTPASLGNETWISSHAHYRAGDYCHGRRIKCWPCQEDPDRCQNCVDFDLVCQYDRPQRRGRPPTTPLAPRPQLATRPLNVSRSRRRSTSSPSPEGAKKDSTAPQSVGRAWRAFARASGSYVGPILNVYFETVYPMYSPPALTRLNSLFADCRQISSL